MELGRGEVINISGSIRSNAWDVSGVGQNSKLMGRIIKGILGLRRRLAAALQVGALQTNVNQEGFADQGPGCQGWGGAEPRHLAGHHRVRAGRGGPHPHHERYPPPALLPPHA